MSFVRVKQLRHTYRVESDQQAKQRAELQEQTISQHPLPHEPEDRVESNHCLPSNRMLLLKLLKHRNYEITLRKTDCEAVHQKITFGHACGRLLD